MQGSTFARGDLTAHLPRAWQWGVQRAQSQSDLAKVAGSTTLTWHQAQGSAA